jgi:hypothetical protein
MRFRFASKKFWISLAVVGIMVLLYSIFSGKLFASNSKLGMFGTVKQSQQSVIVDKKDTSLTRIDPARTQENQLLQSSQKPGVFVQDPANGQIICKDGTVTNSVREVACLDNGGIRQ